MTDDLVKRLRSISNPKNSPRFSTIARLEAADRIEKLECEITSNAIHLDVAMVCMLNDQTRIEKLEAALREIAALGYWDGDSAMNIASKALEGGKI